MGESPEEPVGTQVAALLRHPRCPLKSFLRRPQLCCGIPEALSNLFSAGRSSAAAYKKIETTKE